MWILEPGIKKPEAQGRSFSLEQTERMLESVVRKLPVTRVANLTPLDRLGLPAYSAVTPLAKDLTTHMGKGPDEQSARVSALMEAVERVSAESMPVSKIQRGSRHELNNRGDRQALEPRLFDLPANHSYDADAVYSWIPCHDLCSDERRLMPADLVISPPTEGMLSHADTNGLASGNTVLEAINHAICEVIERDAISQLEFSCCYGDDEHYQQFRNIDLASLPRTALRLCDRIREFGLGISVHDITSDVAVPSIRAIVVDPIFPSLNGGRTLISPGYGTNPNAELAVLRAITEAVQSRIGYIQGARDSFNLLPAVTGASQRGLLRSISPSTTVPFSALPNIDNGQLMDDLNYLIGQLARAGFRQVLAADLTRDDIGIPVVRVRVSGLSGFVANRNRINERCLRHLI